MRPTTPLVLFLLAFAVAMLAMGAVNPTAMRYLCGFLALWAAFALWRGK